MDVSKEGLVSCFQELILLVYIVTKKNFVSFISDRVLMSFKYENYYKINIQREIQLKQCKHSPVLATDYLSVRLCVRHGVDPCRHSTKHDVHF